MGFNRNDVQAITKLGVGDWFGGGLSSGGYREKSLALEQAKFDAKQNKPAEEDAERKRLNSIDSLKTDHGINSFHDNPDLMAYTTGRWNDVFGSSLAEGSKFSSFKQMGQRGRDGTTLWVPIITNAKGEKVPMTYGATDREDDTVVAKSFDEIRDYLAADVPRYTSSTSKKRLDDLGEKHRVGTISNSEYRDWNRLNGGVGNGFEVYTAGRAKASAEAQKARRVAKEEFSKKLTSGYDKYFKQNKLEGQKDKSTSAFMAAIYDNDETLQKLLGTNSDAYSRTYKLFADNPEGFMKALKGNYKAPTKDKENEEGSTTKSKAEKDTENELYGLSSLIKAAGDARGGFYDAVTGLGGEVGGNVIDFFSSRQQGTTFYGSARRVAKYEAAQKAALDSKKVAKGKKAPAPLTKNQEGLMRYFKREYPGLEEAQYDKIVRDKSRKGRHGLADDFSPIDDRDFKGLSSVTGGQVSLASDNLPEEGYSQGGLVGGASSTKAEAEAEAVAPTLASSSRRRDYGPRHRPNFRPQGVEVAPEAEEVSLASPTIPPAATPALAPTPVETAPVETTPVEMPQNGERTQNGETLPKEIAHNMETPDDVPTISELSAPPTPPIRSFPEQVRHVADNSLRTLPDAFRDAHRDTKRGVASFAENPQSDLKYLGQGLADEYPRLNLSDVRSDLSHLFGTNPVIGEGPRAQKAREEAQKARKMAEVESYWKAEDLAKAEAQKFEDSLRPSSDAVQGYARVFSDRVAKLSQGQQAEFAKTISGLYDGDDEQSDLRVRALAELLGLPHGIITPEVIHLYTTNPKALD